MAWGERVYVGERSDGNFALCLTDAEKDDRPHAFVDGMEELGGFPNHRSEQRSCLRFLPGAQEILQNQNAQFNTRMRMESLLSGRKRLLFSLN
jgi:hypothetical protein